MSSFGHFDMEQSVGFGSSNSTSISSSVGASSSLMPTIVPPSPSPSNKRARADDADGGSAPSLDALMAENAKLREQLENVEVQLSALRSPRMGPQAASAVSAAASLGGGSAGSMGEGGGGMPTIHLHHHHKTSKLASGAEIRLTEDEMAAMRQIFALFDADGSGKVTVSSLKNLYLKLGEPLDDNEAAAMVCDIGQGREYISFEDFLLYWDGSHPSQRLKADQESPSDLVAERQRKRQHYQAKFKFMKVRRAMSKTVLT